MKLYLEKKDSKLKIVGRKENGNIVLEIVEDQLGNLVGQLTDYPQDIIWGWIVLEAYDFYVEYVDHLCFIPSHEIDNFLDKLS